MRSEADYVDHFDGAWLGRRIDTKKSNKKLWLNLMIYNTD